MAHSTARLRVFAAATLFATTMGCGEAGTAGGGTQSAQYGDLVALFAEWREFQHPPAVNGVPDYSPAAMTRQYRELAEYQRRLASMDTTGWSVAQQVDYHVVRAEMNGLDFDHRVLRPWSRMPAFYTMIYPAQSDVPAHEGPVAHGWIDVWTYDFPLTSASAAQLASRLRVIPPLLDQAKENLVEDARDLWLGGIRAMAGQSADLAALAERVSGTEPELEAAVESARTATDDFRAWLESEAPYRTGPSGIGI